MSWYFLWILPVLGSLVVIHELGHFVSARVLGIRVEEFGVGFPPRLFAIRRNGIDYSLNALPIGGFVRILGENGDSVAPDSFGVQPAWKRIIVLAAGSFMNLVLALVLFVALGLAGEPVADNTGVGLVSVAPGEPAAAAGLKPGDLLLAVNGTPIVSTDASQDLLKSHLGQTITVSIKRGTEKMEVPVTLKATWPALGVSLYPAIEPVRVSSVQNAAASAGLRPGDVIKAVNGQAATNTVAVAAALDAAKQGNVRLTVDRGGSSQDLTAQLTNGQLSGLSYDVPTHIQTYGVPDAIGRGFSQTGDLLRRIPEGLATTVMGLFSGHNEAGGVAGPVGIAQLTGEVAQQAGLPGLVRLTALLGINLCLINLLPLPALDGGRLLFILVELLRGGRKIAPEKEGMVHVIGMACLLLLMLVITFFDVQNFGKRLLP